ncbi:TRM11 family SAM-dependent methyltransferase [Herbaspirillum chlorophenolicum]|uniref:TRM11 family SAM-dependent methyltransferase n=1 Tax=Herbaspirillum chlorophenolicum TaxID=211589 RepID=UPI00067DBB0E|nr:class I SAM-dependent methyltransferase [Herbaspirillum chlorophenolicum]
MNDNSWLHLQHQDPDWMLPPDLAQRDGFGARDCGWVEQMTPFIRHLCPSGGTVLDPFCGFGSTLVAAHLAGCAGIGIELDAPRATIAAERLGRLQALGQRVLQGDAAQLLPGLEPVDLVLSNVPYFGCSWPQQAESGQLYASGSYTEFLDMLERTLKQLRTCLKPGAHLVLCAENLQVGGHFVPLAWDLARLMADRFELLEERVLIYDRPYAPQAPGRMRSNRAHEYALVARNSSASIDLVQTLATLQDLHAAIPKFLVYGSFARWMLRLPKERMPADADLLLPCDAGVIARICTWLEVRGFTITCWGAPFSSSATEAVRLLLPERHYLRAVRLDRNGALCHIDLCFRDTRHDYATARNASVLRDGLRLLNPALLVPLR